MTKPNWRAILARLPLPMLALAASYGVYKFALLFVPEWVAVVQAAAFETTYIGLAVTRGLDLGGRRRATAISLGAVTASIIYNTLAGWFHAQPGMLAGANDIAWLCLAVLHGAPLAWVAFLVASLLLHQQSDLEAQIANDKALLSAATADLAQARDAYAQLQEATAQPDPLLAQQTEQLAQYEEILAHCQGELAQRETLLAQARQESAQRDRAYSEELRTKERELAQIRGELAQICAAGEIDRVAVARRLRTSGVSSRETADLLRIPESTLRNRLKIEGEA